MKPIAFHICEVYLKTALWFISVKPSWGIFPHCLVYVSIFLHFLYWKQHSRHLLVLFGLLGWEKKSTASKVFLVLNAKPRCHVAKSDHWSSRSRVCLIYLMRIKTSTGWVRSSRTSANNHPVYPFRSFNFDHSSQSGRPLFCPPSLGYNLPFSHSLPLPRAL